MGPIYVSKKETQFETDTIAKEVLKCTLKTNKVVLVPKYMGRWTVRGTVANIPTGYNVLCIAAAVTFDLQDRINILQARKREVQN